MYVCIHDIYVFNIYSTYMYMLKCIRAIYTHTKKLTKIACYSIKRSPYFILKKSLETCLEDTIY